MNNLFEKVASIAKNIGKPKEKEVIQIGVGGFRSSGKTVLIDAMLSCFYKSFCPHYIPQEYKTKLCEASGDSNNAFSSFNVRNIKQLSSEIDERFHLRDGTLALGDDVKENMFQANINIINKNYVLLIRNSPGETFEIFFTKSPSLHYSNLDSIFREYFTGSDVKELYKKYDENNLTSIKTAFKDYLRTEKKYAFNNFENEESKYDQFFFDYLFYISSDRFIYCISPDDAYKNNFPNSIIALRRAEEEYKNLTFCLTQVDRYFLKQDFFNLYDDNNCVHKYLKTDNKLILSKLKGQQIITWEKYNDIMIKMYAHFANNILPLDFFDQKIDRLSSTPLLITDMQVEDNDYNKISVSVAQTLSRIHEIIGDITKDNVRKYFYTTVFMAKRTPMMEKDEFFYNDNELATLSDNYKHNKLVKENNHRRMSLGVYELLLHVLSNHIQEDVIKYTNDKRYRGEFQDGNKKVEHDFFEALTSRVEYVKSK